MTTYTVISGSVQYGRAKSEDKHGKVVFGKSLVADIGDTLTDKQIGAESAARLVKSGVLRVVGDVTDVVSKAEKAEAEKAAAETKQPKTTGVKVAKTDVPAFLSGT